MNKPLLTIGMPTCFDYSGAMFTIRSIVQYQTFDEDDIEIIVVDNTPDKVYRRSLKRQIHLMDSERIHYIEHVNDHGPASAKNKVFEAATGEFVICMDSHVLLAENAIRKLKVWLEYPEHEEGMLDNLFSGPMLMTNGKHSTNMIQKWRGHAWGIWQTDNQILESVDPVEAWGQGCGLLLARKDSWLKFNEHFKGLGGEEGYIHTKYRHNGRKFYILPWLGWWHRFDSPDTKHYDISLFSKVRNHYIAFQELGLPTQEVYDHFVKTDYTDRRTAQGSL